MLSISHLTFPEGLKKEVPCYQVGRFNGKNLELTSEAQHLEVNFARFDPLSIANATATQPEGWEICGLIAVESWAFAQALNTATLGGHARRFGCVLDGVWYQLIPLPLQFIPHLGQYLVVGLYR